jgi:hypothetical protein
MLVDYLLMASRYFFPLYPVVPQGNKDMPIMVDMIFKLFTY